MTIKRTKPQKEETPEEFFAAVKVPDTWQFEKRADWDSTFGKVYLKEPGIYIRLFFDTIPNRGGLCECDTRNGKEKFTCLISNKRSYKLNDWIENNLNSKEDEETDYKVSTIPGGDYL